MVEVPDLGDGFHAMWHELLYLAKNPPAPRTLIGDHMVALHGWRMGRKQPRASKDADILVNARVVSNGTERVSKVLLSRGFSLDGVSPEGIGHRFVNEQVRFDILGPDGIGARAELLTSSGVRTVEVPGGSQALQRTEMVEIQAGKISGLIPVPNLLGSILVKIRAIAVDEQPEAQRGDVAFLLSLVDDPDPLDVEISDSERLWLRRHPEFCDVDCPCYRGIPHAADAATVFRRLSRLR
jgi:hypothetical protein